MGGGGLWRGACVLLLAAAAVGGAPPEDPIVLIGPRSSPPVPTRSAKGASPTAVALTADEIVVVRLGPHPRRPPAAGRRAAID